MGYLVIQSRKGDHNPIHSNTLSDTADRDDELTGILPGGAVGMVLDIQATQALVMKDRKLPGIMVRRKLFEATDREGAARYEVEIQFKVVHRSHMIFRDWMVNEMGFRSSGTTVYLEAISDEAEELFLSLQSAWSTEKFKGIL